MDRLDQLKAKYAPALQKITELGVKLSNLHAEGDVLIVRGAAPSEAAKAEVFSAVRRVDAAYVDIKVDLSVDPTLPTPAAQAQTYTVKAGDTLSKISKEFYGNANRYTKIFEANRDQLSDPDKIKVGQVLKIPAA